MNDMEQTDSIIHDIRSIIDTHRAEAASAINSAMIQAYWEVGRRIVEEEQDGSARASYGTNLIRTLSRRLTLELGKGFSERSLRQYRQFFLEFPDWEIWHTRVPNLKWSHIKILLRVSSREAREWYISETISQMWSARTLDRNVSTQYYNRLLASSPKGKSLVKAEMEQLTSGEQYQPLSPANFIKSPVVTEFLGLPQDTRYTESQLETALIDHLQQFIMELGKGYAFVERQQHIVTDTADYYIDLVFYNYIMKRFVLIDLKANPITHQDVGQMDMYVRMYDDMKATEGDKPTLGIVLCTETSEDIARYSVLHDSDQLFASKIMTFLPTPEELRREIEQQKQIFFMQHKASKK